MDAKSGTAASIERAMKSEAASCARALSLMLIAGLFNLFSGIAHGQGTHPARAAESPMHRHYESAFRFQNAGNISQANTEYKLFLSMALHQMANGHANLGDYAHAAPLYEEAIRLAPGDRGIQVDFAGAALDGSDWRRAKSLSILVLDALKADGEPPDLRAVSVLSHALADLEEHQAALEEYKIAAQLRPGFDSSSDLAIAYLMVGDKSNAAKILGEMPAKLGDTATLHLKLGILFGKTQLFDEAVDEFEKAIERDGKLKGAHYSLGATYMMQLGEAGYDKAVEEFRKELAIDPTNSMAYGPLGRIALVRKKYADAEADLKRAIDSNQRNTGNYLSLGQVYMETKKNSEAEAAFRKAIALATDPSKNDYEVERAHFWLGRLLVQDGSIAEGHRELDASRDLLYLKQQKIQSRMGGSSILQVPLEKTHEADPAALAVEKTFENQAGPVIASSYDNLGVNAANAGDLASASNYFEQAAKWNPTLAGIDENWARAAFSAKEFGKAAEPLGRLVALHPADAKSRAMLGLSLCMTHDFAGALTVLQPLEATQDWNPLLAIAYAGSMAFAGDASTGLDRLKALEGTNSEIALVHSLLGEFYAGKKDYVDSADELKTALKLDPSDTEAKNALALTYLALGQKAEALQLLSELAASGSQDGEIYYRLAQLQIDLVSAQAAVASLETATRLNPMSVAYHKELAEAYRKNAQPEAADREARLSEVLQAQADSAGR